MDLFTSMASHDLKSPLRTIKGFLGLLEKKGQITDAKSQEFLHLAISGTDQLNTLISGISAFKNLENTVIADTFADTNQILDKVIFAIGIKDNPNIIITKPNLPHLKLTPTHLHQIFQNLIENGLKYNENTQKIIEIDYATRRSCLLYTSPSPRDRQKSRMPSSA